MALINCPECKKEMSDTLDKCPHCGFKVKNGNDKVKEVVAKLKDNKKLVVSLVIILVLVLMLGFVFSKINLSKSYAEKAKRYFENEGYECNKDYILESGNGDVYVCTDKDGDIKHKYVISWGSEEFFVSKILEGSKLFNVTYNFNSNGMEYTLRDDFFGNWRFSVVSLLNSESQAVCNFVPKGFSESDHVTFEDEDAVVYTEDCEASHSSYKSCTYCNKYLDEFNDSLDTFKDLYDEIDLELVR